MKNVNWEHEIRCFLNALRKTSLPSVSRKKIVLELIANGIAGLCALVVYAFLQKFFVVKSVRNLWGFAAKKDKMLIRKDTFEWISGVIIFVVALFVFTYVEKLIEEYLVERQKKVDRGQ